ncbi:Highly reducing polyketide synthase alt5 [Cladobotryum mycophilum]|uniref:Highly reducing polyketide synthase alt5 n=1 Tax=Cladobotryum mycophilum TaxID=491253 RepID=A0ABR0T5D1_9HYPO
MEANAMDPQQRILLEVTYEAFENAGLSMNKMQGSNTSCFIGAFTTDYRDNMTQDLQSATEYTGAGCSNALSSNRISWFYDLRGQSMTVDTACSSSLSAFHLACQSLLSGESEVGIVGGTSLMLGPSSAVTMSSAHLLSPDGMSYAFDHRANGYSRGEGIGIVILRRLGDALRHGNTIRAVVRSTGCNQGGRTAGVSLPSSAAQESLIRATYRRAGLNPAETGYVEAHGTGTQVGDPIEMGAIVRAFGEDRSSPLFVGSVKTNVGHLEGAAGMASLIKSIHIVETGLIPPSLGFEKLNPKIALPEHIQVPTRLETWPTSGVRRASINSFGFGGANAHIILEDAFHFLNDRNLKGRHATIQLPTLDVPAASLVQITQNRATDTQVKAESRRWIFPLSSLDEKGASRYAARLLQYVQTKSTTVAEIESTPLLGALAGTLAERVGHPWKSFVTASTLSELAQSLEAVPKTVRSSQTTPIAFVFTGQGAQWWAMGRELCVYDVYRDSIRASSQYMQRFGSAWALEEELGRAATESRLRDPCVAQPACTAVQIALVDLLESIGIEPVAVTGHSSGEIAAAYAAGAISHADALRIAYYRGYCASSLR